MPSVAAVAGWCGAITTSTREPLLGMPVGACHAVPGRSVFPPLEPGAVRLSEITAFCRLAPRLLHEPRRTSGTVGGAQERLTPFIRLENCSTESVLQPKVRQSMAIALPRPPRRAPFWDLHTPRGPSAGWSRHHCLSLDGSMAGMLGTIRAAGSALPARR